MQKGTHSPAALGMTQSSGLPLRAPKMTKSYHSKAVPADEAVTTRAIDHGLASDIMLFSIVGCGIAIVWQPRGQ